MNREQTIEAIKVMQAWVDGEVVQCYWADEWHDMPHYDVNWSLFTHAYRIKPKPMRKYVVIDSYGAFYGYDSFECCRQYWSLDGESEDIRWHGWMVEEPK